MGIFPDYARNPLDTLDTGTIDALNETVELVLEGHKSCTVTVSGTWVGTLVVESSTDNGVTWVRSWLQSIVATSQYAVLRPVNSFTSNGTYAVFSISGITHYRVRAHAWTSGSANIGLTATEQPPIATFTSASMIQNVLVSDINSSTDNLAASATFTGTAEDTLGVVGLQVTLKTDQNCTVYVDQSPDGTNWDITDEFSYKYSFGGNGWTIQAQNSYVRVRVTNEGASTTTYFRLQTVMCPMVEALPRSLCPRGNLKVTVQEIHDYAAGFKTKISPTGELRTTDHIRLVGSKFEGTVLDPSFWTETSTGSGSIDSANSELVLSTGATADSTVLLQSVAIGRYVGGYPNYYRGVVECPATTGTCVRRWGAFDVDDGFFFEHDGTTLSVVTRKGGVDTKVSSGSFNGEEGEDYSIDTDATTYEIMWTNSSTWFYVGNYLIHKADGTTTPLANTHALKVGANIINSGGNTADNALHIRTCTIHRIGPLQTESRYRYVTGTTAVVLKYGAGRIHRVINCSGSGDVLLYDNTAASGQIIAELSLNDNMNYEFGCAFNTGLTVQGSLAGTDFTVIYE